MNVLFITTWFPYKENTHKGIFILEHAKACKAIGVNIQVIFINIIYSKKIFQKTYEEYFMDGIKVYKYEIASTFWKWFYINPFLWRYLGKWVFKKKLDPNFQSDIIHSNVSFPALIIGDHIAKKINKPQVLTEHWSGLHSYLTENLFSYLARNAYTRVSAFIVVSEFLKEQVQKDINNCNLKIIPNIVSDEFKFNSGYNSSPELRFACVGNWQLPKRLDLIIESLNRFAEKEKQEVRLKIIGTGAQINFYKDFKTSQYFNIEFSGSKSKAEITEIFKLTDFFIHASNYETFSIVVAEALKCGIPVIASKAGAIPEIINSNCGILTENTITAFCTGIQALVKQAWDRKQIADFFENKYSYKQVGEMHLDIYRDVLNSK